MAAKIPTRIGWYAAGVSVPVTLLLGAFGGVREDPWWYAFAAILGTAAALWSLVRWGRKNRLPEKAAETDESAFGKPIDWGVGSALPPDAFTF